MIVLLNGYWPFSREQEVTSRHGAKNERKSTRLVHANQLNPATSLNELMSDPVSSDASISGLSCEPINRSLALVVGLIYGQPSTTTSLLAMID